MATRRVDDEARATATLGKPAMASAVDLVHRTRTLQRPTGACHGCARPADRDGAPGREVPEPPVEAPHVVVEP
jgi:hypothetical protein